MPKKCEFIRGYLEGSAGGDGRAHCRIRRAIFFWSKPGHSLHSFPIQITLVQLKTLQNIEPPTFPKIGKLLKIFKLTHRPKWFIKSSPNHRWNLMKTTAFGKSIALGVSILASLLLFSCGVKTDVKAPDFEMPALPSLPDYKTFFSESLKINCCLDGR